MNTWIRIATSAAAVAVAATGVVVSTSGAAQAAAPQCRSADVRASYHDLGAAAGNHYGQIRLTNISDTACFVRGYGGLSYVGHGDGTQVGAPADRDASRRPRVVLQPGDRAVSRIDEVQALNYPRGRCRPAHVDGFRVYVPDSTVSQYVAHPTTGCRNTWVHLISQRPYHAG
jgi:hypothetical protein